MPLEPASSTQLAGIDARYAVVDLETTGLDPALDRIVECAVLSLDESGAVTDEWHSLVCTNSTGELGAAFLHGLTTEALVGAPQFADLLGELVSRLSGRVVVGHVLAFDVAFLSAESARAGYCLPAITHAGLCTRELARNHLQGSSYSLAACCERAAVVLEGAHTALGDARATAGLLRHFLSANTLAPHAPLAAAATLRWPPAPVPTCPPRVRGATPSLSLR